MSEPGREIRCMMIPLHGDRLLLPNAAVAEIIGYRQPERGDTSQPWLQGLVDWHQRQIPVIDFENLSGDIGLRASIRQRIVVTYAPDTDRDRPLIGLLSQGIPRLLRLSETAIEDATEGPKSNSAIKMRVRVAGDSYIVPDLSDLQARLSSV